MGELSNRVGTGVSVFLGIAPVVFGGYRLQYGTGTVEELFAFTFLGIAIVAGYHSLTMDSEPQVNAIGNTALFVAGVAAYGGGVNFGFGLALAVGQALFAIAVGYFLVRLV
jgi:hypothetical protein